MALQDWTPAAIFTHFSELRKADKEAVKIAQEAAQRASDKAEDAQKAVNKTQNEFRGTLKDQAATLMPIKEAEQKFEAQGSRISKLENFQSKLIGMALIATVIMPIITGVIVYILTRHTIPSIPK